MLTNAALTPAQAVTAPPTTTTTCSESMHWGNEMSEECINTRLQEKERERERERERESEKRERERERLCTPSLRACLCVVSEVSVFLHTSAMRPQEINLTFPIDVISN